MKTPPLIPDIFHPNLLPTHQFHLGAWVLRLPIMVSHGQSISSSENPIGQVVRVQVRSKVVGGRLGWNMSGISGGVFMGYSMYTH